MEALSGSSDFSEFYERLKVIKEHHRKFPNEPVESPEGEFIYLLQRKEEEDYEGKKQPPLVRSKNSCIFKSWKSYFLERKV